MSKLLINIEFTNLIFKSNNIEAFDKYEFEKFCLQK